jgi:hypothetical protein
MGWAVFDFYRHDHHQFMNPNENNTSARGEREKLINSPEPPAARPVLCESCARHYGNSVAITLC